MTEFLELSRLFCLRTSDVLAVHMQQYLLRVNHTKKTPCLVVVALSVVRGGETVVGSSDSEIGQTQ